MHFGRGVRTVQRWERELGLPVHRFVTKGSEVVYALPSELDAWWDQTNRSRTPRAPAAPALPPPAYLADRAVTRRDLLGRATLVVALLILGLMGVRDGWLRGLWPGGVPISEVSQPVSWRFDHQLLQVSDAQGTPLWEHSFGYPVDEGVYRTGFQSDGHAPSVVIDDVDGNGAAEVLLVPWASDPANRRLWCFTASGAIGFTAPVAGGLIRPAPGRDPEWSAARFTVTGDRDRAKSIWLTAPHWRLPDTIIQRLDGGGRLRSEYRSRGPVSVMKALTVRGRRMLLVGGSNAALQTASLALLDYSDGAGTDPAVTPDEPACEGCNPAAPIAYLVFPRLGVAAAASRQPMVDNVRVRSDGGLEVSVLQARIGLTSDRPFTHAAVIYQFSPDLRFESAMATDQYRLAQADLHLGNRVTHPFDVSDQRALMQVRAWQSGALVPVTVGAEVPFTR